MSRRGLAEGIALGLALSLAIAAMTGRARAEPSSPIPPEWHQVEETPPPAAIEQAPE